MRVCVCINLVSSRHDLNPIHAFFPVATSMPGQVRTHAGILVQGQTSVVASASPKAANLNAIVSRNSTFLYDFR